MQSGGHRRELTMAIEPPYTGPRLKDNLVGHGKIFIRPLQRDLDVTPIHSCGDTDEVRSSKSKFVLSPQSITLWMLALYRCWLSIDVCSKF